MKSLLVATAFALAFGCADMASAAPAVGGIDGIHAGSGLVQKAGYRHRRCAWRHGHRRCWWG